jgi:hypothetical protein
MNNNNTALQGMNSTKRSIKSRQDRARTLDTQFQTKTNNCIMRCSLIVIIISVNIQARTKAKTNNKAIKQPQTPPNRQQNKQLKQNNLTKTTKTRQNKATQMSTHYFPAFPNLSPTHPHPSVPNHPNPIPSHPAPHTHLISSHLIHP